MLFIMIGLEIILLTGVIVIGIIDYINEVKKFRKKIENYIVTGEWR